MKNLRQFHPRSILDKFQEELLNLEEENRRLLEREPRPVRLDRAARKLGMMDQFLRSKGFHHLIFISPSREQVVNGSEKNPRVQNALENNGLEVIYLLDTINQMDFPTSERETWYQDRMHLTKEGHEIWGQLIQRELNRALSLGELN